MKPLSILKIIALLSISATCFFCETTYVPTGDSGQIEYVQGNTMGKVVLKLFDSHSMSILNNVLVLFAGGDSVYTDSMGDATFDSIKVGSYLVTCSKPGYQSIITQLVISIDINSNTVPIVQQSADILYLPKKGGSVTGIVFYQHDQTKYPVTGAAVELSFSSPDIDFIDPVKITTTVNGTYSFHDLPEYSMCNIFVKPFTVNGITYKFPVNFGVATEGIGDTISAPLINLQQVPTDQFIILSSNIQTLKSTDSLFIRFSEPVNISQINEDSVFIRRGGSTKMLTTMSWYENNTRLSIKPFDAIWSTQYSYYLTLKRLKSTTNKILDNKEFTSRVFRPVLSGQLGDVPNFRYRVYNNDTVKVDYNTSTVEFLWSAIANANTYEIYKKTTDDSSWILTAAESDTQAIVSTSGYFNYGKTAQFLILGKNSMSLSPLTSAKKLTLSDQKGPSIYYNTTAYGFRNYSSDPKIVTIRVSTSAFYEPMDTTQKPKIRVYEGGNSGDEDYKVSSKDCIWIWDSNKTASIQATIAGSENGAYDTIRVDCTMLKDIAGNKAETDTTNQLGFINFITRN